MQKRLVSMGLTNYLDSKPVGDLPSVVKCEVITASEEALNFFLACV